MADPPSSPHPDSGSRRQGAGAGDAAGVSRDGVSWDGETREMASVRERAIGPYLVELKIGEGGMGVVYKARDEVLGRFVAIKVLKEKLKRNDRYLERLKREARAVASVSHPAVIQVFAFEDGSSPPQHGAPELQLSSCRGLPYLVMEHVEGESIEARLERCGRIAPREAVAIAAEVARGLRAAHERGIIHRDIKPSNLLLCAAAAGGTGEAEEVTAGAVKIVDFGLSKDLDADASITDDGIVLGTPHYISPEQGQGRAVDHRSDIYSLGATLYHMVTGRPVFEGDSQASIIYAHVHTDPEPPDALSADVSPELARVIGTMLAKDPAARYGTYDELIDDLGRIERGEAPSRRGAAGRRRPVGSRHPRLRAAAWFVAGVATCCAVAILAIGVVMLWRGTPPAAGSLLEPYVRSRSGTDSVVLVDFRSMSQVEDRRDRLRDIFAIPPGVRFLLHPAAGLRIEGAPTTTMLRVPLGSLRELTLEGVRIHGLVDVAVVIRHPSGRRVRALHVTLRGDRRENSAPVAEPIIARTRGEKVPISPSPPALRPLLGPHDVSLRFAVEAGDRTRVFLTVSRQEGRSGPRVVYPEDGGTARGFVLPGTGWNSGVIEIRTESAAPRSAATAALGIGSVKITGRFARRWPPAAPGVAIARPAGREGE